MNDEIRILNLLAIPLRHWRIVALATGAAVVVALLIVVLRPPRYLVETLLVPSSTPNSGVGGQLLSDQLPPAFLNAAGSASEDRRLIGAVLRSRTLRDSVVSRLGFTPYEDSAGEAEVRRVLQRHTTLENNTDGTVVVRVRDTDRDRATRIGEAFPPLINGILAEMVADASRQRQEFLQTQLLLAHQQLEDSEHELLAFQQTQDAPEIQEQARQTLQAAAALQAEILTQQILVSQLRRTLTPDHPELRAAVLELQERESQLARLTRGPGLGGSAFPSLGESAGLRVDYTRLLRDYTRDEQVYLSLARALGEAQISANSSLPVLSVLDPAVEPRGPSGMPAAMVLGMAALLGLVIGVGGAFGYEFFRRAQQDEANRPFFDAIGANWQKRSGDATG